MTMKLLCALLVSVLITSDIGRADYAANKLDTFPGGDETDETHPGSDVKDEKPDSFTEQLAFIGTQLDTVLIKSAVQIAMLSAEVDTLKNVIQTHVTLNLKNGPAFGIHRHLSYVRQHLQHLGFSNGEYIGTEPEPETNNEPPVEEEEPEPGSGTANARSTMQRLAQLLAERKLSEQKEAKINALRRMLKPLP